MKQHWLKIVGAVVLLLIGAGFFFQTESKEILELVVQPERGVFELTVTTTGELQAQNSVQIRGPSNARQARIYEMKVLQLVPEGTEVEKGDFVAELDRSELTSNIQDAEIELQKAQSQYEQAMLDTSLTLSEARDEQVELRYQMEEAQLRMEQATYEAPSVRRQAEIDYEKAKRAYEQATVNYKTKVRQGEAKMREVGAELAKAQKEFDELEALSAEFTISAPEDGMVVYYRNYRGEKLTTGGTISAWRPVVATLPDLSTMESITYINEVDIQKIDEGQHVRIGLDADPDKKLTGTVTKVANIGEQRPNSDAKVFEVIAKINQPDTTLRPAMTTSNTIVVASLPDVLSVPLEAIHTRDSVSFVYAKRAGGLIRQEVELGLLNENRAVVEAGLSTDDDVYLSMPADTTGLALHRLDGSNLVAAKNRE